MFKTPFAQRLVLDIHFVLSLSTANTICKYERSGALAKWRLLIVIILLFVRVTMRAFVDLFLPHHNSSYPHSYLGTLSTFFVNTKDLGRSQSDVSWQSLRIRSLICFYPTKPQPTPLYHTLHHQSTLWREQFTCVHTQLQSGHVSYHKRTG